MPGAPAVRVASLNLSAPLWGVCVIVFWLAFAWLAVYGHVLQLVEHLMPGPAVTCSSFCLCGYRKGGGSRSHAASVAVCGDRVRQSVSSGNSNCCADAARGQRAAPRRGARAPRRAGRDAAAAQRGCQRLQRPAALPGDAHVPCQRARVSQTNDCQRGERRHAARRGRPAGELLCFALCA